MQKQGCPRCKSLLVQDYDDSIGRLHWKERRCPSCGYTLEYDHQPVSRRLTG